VLDLICGSAQVTAIAFSPDGTQLLTGSKDGKVRLWDIAGNEVALRLLGHDKPLASCIFTLDGTKVVTASVDGTVNFWERSNGMLLATLHHVGRGFLWTAPPDEAAPCGWFWTDRPELLSVLCSGMEGELPTALPHDDPSCSAYLDSGMYNRRDLTMSRLNDFVTYQREIERIVGRIGDRQLGWELNRRPALTGGK
jgi:WD40 repeat protein